MSFVVAWFSLLSKESFNEVSAISVGGIVGGLIYLQRAVPTRIFVEDGHFNYIVENVEEVISEFRSSFLNERKVYGFIWGYKKEQKSPDNVLFIPLGHPKYPNGILGSFLHSKIKKLVRYGGITSVIEVRQENGGISIYGPLVAMKKIYSEIS